ncbi:MAG: hypothetical protein NC347_14055 [Clostridium sp.]|nr:hypothetical protein [Clostridium sp.]
MSIYLYEMAGNKMTRFSTLPDSLECDKLKGYLKSIINFEDEEMMDYILCIIPRLGMGNLFDYILKNRTNIHNENVKINIREAESEYGCNVDDPYAGV